jgi:hypothetical protein
MRVLIRCPLFFIIVRNIFLVAFFLFVSLQVSMVITLAHNNNYENSEDEDNDDYFLKDDSGKEIKINNTAAFLDLAYNITHLPDGKKLQESIKKQDGLDPGQKNFYSIVFNKQLNKICNDNNIDPTFDFDEQNKSLGRGLLNELNINGFNKIALNKEYNSYTLKRLHEALVYCAKEGYKGFLNKKPEVDNLILNLKNKFSDVAIISPLSLKDEIDEIGKIVKSDVFKLNKILLTREDFINKVESGCNHIGYLEPEKEFRILSLIDTILKNEDILNSDKFVMDLVELKKNCSKLFAVYDDIRFYNKVTCLSYAFKCALYDGKKNTVSLYKKFLEATNDKKPLLGRDYYERLYHNSIHKDTINIFMDGATGFFYSPIEKFVNLGEITIKVSRFVDETLNVMPADNVIDFLCTANYMLNMANIRLKILDERRRISSASGLNKLEIEYNKARAKECALYSIIEQTQKVIERNPISFTKYLEMAKANGYKWGLTNIQYLFDGAAKSNPFIQNAVKKTTEAVNLGVGWIVGWSATQIWKFFFV